MGFQDSPVGQTVVFGSQDITIGGTVFVLEQGSIEEPVTWTTQRNSSGSPSKEFGVPDVPMGSMTLQLPSATFTPPNINDRFTAVPVWGGTPYNLKVAGRGQTWNNNGVKVMTINVRGVLNP